MRLHKVLADKALLLQLYLENEVINPPCQIGLYSYDVFRLGGCEELPSVAETA